MTIQEQKNDEEATASITAVVENGIKKENKFILETAEERRDRMWSLRIVYFTMFLVSLGFSIVLTGIWPYLDKVS